MRKSQTCQVWSNLSSLVVNLPTLVTNLPTVRGPLKTCANLPSLIVNLSTLARKLANWVRPGHDLVGPETAPQSTESPGTPDTRKSEHSGCGVALQVRGGRAASAQGVAQLWLASPCTVEVETMCATEECALGGQVVKLCRCPAGHLAFLATRPLGWRVRLQ